MPGGISRLAKGPDGTIYAGGTMTFVIDPDNGVFNTGIAFLKKNSLWAPFHGGIDGGFLNEVRAIAFAPDGDLLIGGTFGSAGFDNPVPASHLARYDFQTNTWSEIGGGVQNDVGLSIGSETGVNDILVLDDGTFWIGGLFSSVKGGTIQTANLATLKNDAWPQRDPLRQAVRRRRRPDQRHGAGQEGRPGRGRLLHQRGRPPHPQRGALRHDRLGSRSARA